MASYQAERKYIQEMLERAGIEDAASDTMLLLEYICGADRNFYLLHQMDEMPQQLSSDLHEAAQRRCSRVPLQHITGHQEFMGLDFLVNSDVLIPRQETELLVSTAAEMINLVMERSDELRPMQNCAVLRDTSPDLSKLRGENGESRYVSGECSVLDMCTGSGCIAVSLAVLCKSAHVTAADISPKALEIARENAKRNNAGVTFVQSDLFKGNCMKGAGFDIIISNPPYIKSSEIETLLPEVRCHEPLIALDGREDGLYFYREIIEQAPDFLNSGGHLLFEIGYDQGCAVRDFMAAAGFTEIEVMKDLSGLDRVVYGRKI